jgi:sugar lactone lactonase YvrE
MVSVARLFRRCVFAGLMAAGLGVAHAQTYAVSTLAGSSAGFALTVPSGAVVDSSGNIYLTDALNNAVKKITSAGVVSTLVSSGLSSPQGIAIDGSGNLYVADSGNGAVKKYNSSGVLQSPVLATGLTTPYGIAVDSAGATVYVADAGTSLIKKIVVAGPTVSTLAGGGSDSPTATSTVLTNAQFALPSGLALNAAGTILYVADTNNNLIRQINISGATVSVLAGSTSGYTEGSGSGAQFKNPRGIALFGSNLVVADTLNQVIRVVTAGGATSLLAGISNTQGSTDGLALGVATFKNPTGITADSTNVYVVDTTNQSLRKIAQASAPVIGGGGQPTGQVVTAGNTATFTVASVTGNPPVTYQWQVSTDSGATWNNVSNGAITGGTVSGATTASLSIASVTSALNANQYRVVISNGVTPNSTSSAALLTVNQPPVISNSATTFNATVNSAISGAQITASGSPAPTFAITSGAGALASAGFSLNTTTGVISGTPTSNGTINFTVTATNTAGTSSGVAFTISVVSGPSVGTQPGSASVAAGNNQTFTVSANANGGTLSYQWQVSTDSGATWNNIADGAPTNYTGTTTATLTVNSALVSQSGYQFRVVVTSTVGSPATVTSNAAALTVTQAPSFTSGNSTTFVTGQSNSFSITATGSPAPTFSIIGTLPSTVGTLTNYGSGTATIAGTPGASDATNSPYTFTIQAQSSAGTVTQGFTLSVSTAAASPTISTQPSNQTVQVAANATFTAAATGNPTPTVQWQRQPAGTSGYVTLSDDSTYSGSATGTLTITNVQAGMTGDQFQLVATNSNGSVTSSAATLTVNIGTAFTTFAGTAGQFGTADGTGAAARFNSPASIVYDASSGSFYVADSSNHVIRKVSAAGVVTTFAGTAGSSGNADGTGAAARFNGPSAVTVDSVGNVYVADTYNQTIRAISPAGVVTTLAGLPNNSGFIDGTGTAARFSFPSGIVADSAGNLYVADTSNHNIRKVTTSGVVTTFAGGYAGSLSTGAVGITGSSNGNGASARFNYPDGLARDTSGNLYVADSYNHAIRKIDTSANVTTLAGSVGSIGSTDANGTAAKFDQPLGVAVDSSGNVYVADTYNDTIRKIDTSANVTTLAGVAGQTGSTDGIGAAARFNQPFGITVDGNGNLYVVDTRNFTIRRSGTTTAPGITTQPSNQSGVIGGNATFTIVATGVPAPSYQWQRQPANSSGFTNLVNDSVNFSGVTTATLTVSNISSLNDGDQYRVILSNGISPTATSNAATFSLVTPPTFTSASSATFNVGQSSSFGVTTTSSTTVTYTATGLPQWLSLNPSTGVLSGTPPDASASPLTLTISANNGGVTTQTFTLTLVVPVVAPSVTTQPVGLTVNRGDSAAFSVTAAGTAPFTYQWSKNGVPLTGATSSVFSLANVQAANAGNYSVTVTNSVGSTTSNLAILTVNGAPVISAQPRSQTVLAGGSATFSVSGAGSPSPTFQWRFNGAPITGANSSSYTIGSAQSANAGNYDVVVTNIFGAVVSSEAQLTIVSAASAPVVTSQPASRTALVGSSTTFSVAAQGAPAPAYQWRKNGTLIGGAVSSSYIIGNVQAGDAANYDVVISNSAGSVTSSAANLRVIARSYAGIYSGSFGTGLGSFMIYIRADNTGVLLGYLPGSNIPVKNLNVSVSDSGQFSFTQSATGAISSSSLDGSGAPRAAAAGDIAFIGTISTGGTLTGSVTGVSGASLSGVKLADNGATQSYAGFYTAAAANSSSSLFTIASATGQAFALNQTSTTADGGSGGIDASGHVSAVGSRTIISATVSPDTSTISGTTNVGGTITTYSGASEAVIATQRLGNISTRANVGTGNNVAIAGFVISGTDSKPVLIRAIGPTLSLFGIGSPLSNPKLELFNGANVSIANNTGWSTAPNTAAITAASSQAGAFALGSTSADSVIFTTLAPGNYTAVVSSANGGTGVALIEVYDLSAASAGQKLFNISTRANAGTGANTLAAGFVINGSVPKRVLIRGVGPGLVQFGFSNALGATQLQLISSSNQVLVQNTGWGTSADASAIATAASQVGAFPLVAGSLDSAMIVSLAPGNYTAQINPVNGTTGGIAIIEVYELP